MSAAYAVIGWPLGHTLSPVIHQAALDEMGLEATYTALPTPPGTEHDRFEDVRTGNLAGLNVTIPHKLAAFRAMDRLTPAAERTGAVNTVIRDGPRLLGDNTDPYGFIEALRQFGGFDPAGTSAVVLGAGGAARAAVLALLDSDARRIVVANRTEAPRLPTRRTTLDQLPAARRIDAYAVWTESRLSAGPGRRPTSSSTPPASACPAAPRPAANPGSRLPGSTPASSSTTSSTAPP